MARPRTPTKVLEMRGAFKKNPNRAREDAQAAGELTDPPEHVTDSVLQAWREIVQYAPLGVMTDSDRLSIEVAANLLSQFRADPVEMPAAKLARLEAMLGKFGMSPADRAKVGGTSDAPTGNPFADL